MREMWVDFNEVDSLGQVTTLAEYLEPNLSGPRLGQALLVGDDDGNVCEARVVSIGAHGVVSLALDMSTFRLSRNSAASAV